MTQATDIAAIDTGTTLVGGPPDDIARIYQQVPGSQQGTGQMSDFWMIPCSSDVTVTMSFGGPQWQISPEDFNAGALQGSNSMCMGAFFAVELPASSPRKWIVGDTFLKNVYSVFRFQPPAVGFAQLSSVALGMNDVDGPPPTPTIRSANLVSNNGTSSGAAGQRQRR